MVRTYRRHHPIEVEAIKYDSFYDYERICEWINRHGDPSKSNMAEDIVEYRRPLVLINNIHGTMGLMKGDYLVRDMEGNYMPYKPEIFEAIYKEI